MRTLLICLLVMLAVAGCNLTNEAQPTATPPPPMPKVEFLYPANEATVVEGTDLDVELLASDEGIGIARIELLVDEEIINERGPDVSAAVPLFTVRMNWLAQGQGRHTLSAIAYRPDGTASDIETILVNVLPPDGDLTALTAQPTNSTAP